MLRRRVLRSDVAPRSYAVDVQVLHSAQKLTLPSQNGGGDARVRAVHRGASDDSERVAILDAVADLIDLTFGRR